MRFKIKKCDVCIDYVFIFVLSITAIFNSKQMLLLLLFSALHETGHLVALLYCKSFPNEIKYDDDLPILKECIVLISGPTVNLILYLVFKNEINLILFSLNMLPVYPLDFGRVVRLFSLKASKILSIITLVFICILCSYLIFYKKVYSLLFVTVYLVIYSINYD